MGMSFAYGATDDEESLRVLHRYVALGGNFLDTAEVYGPYDNELLLGRFLREVPREQVVVATKFGFRINPSTRTIDGVDSSPANIRRACDESLRRLGVDTIDLLYQHRVDPQVPIEETVGTMAELVRAGKVRALGLSEAAPDTLRRATSVHPIAALQSEYSLWTRVFESERDWRAVSPVVHGQFRSDPVVGSFGNHPTRDELLCAAVGTCRNDARCVNTANAAKQRELRSGRRVDVE